MAAAETGRARDRHREVAGALRYMTAKSRDFILFEEKPLQVV